jgi:FdrA protein
VYPNSYFDSVTLMRLNTDLAKYPGVNKVSVMMGTPANLALMTEQELWNAESPLVTPIDLCIAINYEDEDNLTDVKTALETFLKNGGLQNSNKKVNAENVMVRSWLQGAQVLPDPKVAFISVPGPFAAAEAKQALEAGFDVFLFSDNVALDDEMVLKQRAQQLGLIVMGPDCGTSLLSGAHFGFVNHVQAGSVGIVAASGTGAQEVSCALDRAGIGISHIIGTGGRDLSEAVGGISTRQALQWMSEDDKTERILLISKPPAVSVAERLIKDLQALGKPVGVLFLGSKVASKYPRVNFFHTLGELIAWAGGGELETPPVLPRHAGRNIRALYVGGTFAHQAAGLMNVHPSEGGKPWMQKGDCIIDFGDDRFTVGRPHPMIDGGLRQEAIKEALLDDQTGVVVCDVLLGDGSEEDPAGRVAEAVNRAKGQRTSTDFPAVVAHVVGTKQDPQGYEGQIKRLRDEGVIVTETSTTAVLAALASVR